jgi:hypothetical protein
VIVVAIAVFVFLVLTWLFWRRNGVYIAPGIGAVGGIRIIDAAELQHLEVFPPSLVMIGRCCRTPLFLTAWTAS